MGNKGRGGQMETKELVTIILGVVGTVGGFVFGYTNFLRNTKLESSQTGVKDGALLSDIGYIKSGIDDLKRKQEKSEERHIEIITRLTSAENAITSANKRLDTVEKRLDNAHEVKEG
jgi:hypothetical protein